FEEFARFGGADGAPGVPGDLEDDECDHEADDRVGDADAERNCDRGRDDAEGDETVDAGVVAVGDQRRVAEATAATEADLGGELVAEETDHPGPGKDPEVAEVLRVNEALNRLVERNHS